MKAYLIHTLFTLSFTEWFVFVATELAGSPQVKGRRLLSGSAGRIARLVTIS